MTAADMLGGGDELAGPMAARWTPSRGGLAPLAVRVGLRSPGDAFGSGTGILRLGSSSAPTNGDSEAASTVDITAERVAANARGVCYRRRIASLPRQSRR